MRWKLGHQLTVIGGLVIVAVILWLDIATGLWNDYVILSGLAAGLVTFLLTALIIDRVVARSNHRRWAPVTRLALTDMLHALADDDVSEVAHGKIVPRTLTPPGDDRTPATLRHDVVKERRRLATVLAQWSNFLAVSADATEVLDHIADAAERLDLIRDISLELESAPHQSSDASAALLAEVVRYNDTLKVLVAELQQLIESTNRIERAAVPLIV